MISGCKEPYTPEIDPQYKNLLVVEGFISIGGETTIKLSKTADLQNWESVIPEKNYNVIIEGDKGTNISGISGENGEAKLATENLNLEERYKLRIINPQGKEYETDYLESKLSPEIEDLIFKIEDFGFGIYLNTQDINNNSRFYSWDFSETWEVNSAFSSKIEYLNGKLVPRNPDVNIEYCWASSNSSDILLANSERLTNDIITLMPITYIVGNSPKIGSLYSILVKQYVLTKDAYNYNALMKKNTEQIGGIFDSQPSELKGNVICISNPQENVIGWVSAGTTSEKRIFIGHRDKPPNRADWMYREICDVLIVSPDSLVHNINNRKLIISENRMPMDNGETFINYNMATASCIDCRLRGSNVKPDYWPN
jgi:hypothetical protein